MTILSISEDIQEEVHCSHCGTDDGVIYKNHDAGTESFDCNYCGLSVEYPM
ncbi:hypothetical protein [Aliivibrio sifiae]|uniref:TFIIB-type domain-containing protein n=1 Tax=Aliivibrio sifiae TaxID=566293 RepID=A0ABQ6AMV3_9GAMM|nr:hypothetical protein [Aliivibrio sifiae]GLR76797.1 hypothetical protein GCM10007855_36720 [Aliivibrio sifiae]